MAEKRIISLSPAATEIICQLGLRHQLIGRSKKCEVIEAVQDLPVCSFEQVDSNFIMQLDPDFVFVDEHFMNELKVTSSNIIDLKFATLTDLFTNISIIGEALAAKKNADELIEKLQERVDIISHKLKFSEIKPKTACITDLSPLVIGGNVLSEMIGIAGGAKLQISNIVSTGVDLGDFRLEDPQVIIIMPEKYSIQRTLQEINSVLNIPGWSDLSAVRNNQVYIADNQSRFCIHGTNLVDGVEIFAEIIQPKQFVFGYEGTSWIKFNS